jgi:uncharacterized protein (TIGR00369 family)
MSVHQEWINNLKLFPGNLTLPPPTLNELGIEYTEVISGTKMVARVPFQKRFTNPVGLYQGGMLTAAIDEVMGPLSYITAGGPCMTLAMNVTFLGAFKEEMNHATIEATVLKKTKNFIFLRAEVKSPSGELLAHAESHVKVI